MTISQRTLGTTNPLTVSSLGLGCMGMSEFYGTPDEQGGLDTIHRALDLGVTFLDTCGIAPFIEAARRRAARHRPPILIGACSDRARQFFDISRLGADPYLDLLAWDGLQPSEEWIETRCH